MNTLTDLDRRLRCVVEFHQRPLEGMCGRELEEIPEANFVVRSYAQKKRRHVAVTP
ncbi:hypothetical protein [Paraburkholderia sp. BL6669N2]|uniref:hypothetical protein n=1 Tax=Paraburkholderia sp. BL6669N2 TaxID=1938807 RepID=UPI0015F25CF0|nr:hypothetical protein [Paraburkholderia sp. BL6669N2]